MKHAFHPEAIEEYLGAVSYYADISPRLAESFVKAIESGTDEMLAYIQKLGGLSKKMCDATLSSAFHSAFTIALRATG